MGANAQTSVPAFTAGQVLTAQQQTEINTGVPVFADATARNAAFGGTGEKTLAEGQLAYLEDSNIVQYYDGSNWLTLAPSAAPGLELISSTTIGSAVASVTVSNAFSATYDNYRITVTGGAASTLNNLNLTLGATTTGYYYGGAGAAYGGGSAQLFFGSNAALFLAGEGSTSALFSAVDVFSPFLADETVFNSFLVGIGTTRLAAEISGFLNNTTSYTAFTITASTGTFTGGTIKVYGYKN